MTSSGDWTLHAVRLATLPVPGWECVFGKNDCAMREIAFWVWILRSGSQTGIIDAGLPDGGDLERLNCANQKLDPRSIFAVENTLEAALTHVGVAPRDIDFLLISQLITYSTGGLLRRNLPNAHVYCAWAGMRELLKRCPGHPPREFYLTAKTWAYMRELLVEDRITFADEPVEPAPGIVFDPTGGHHPGSAGVRIKTKNGLLGILETAFVQENIDREIPIGIAENAALCREVIRRYKKQCDFVVAGRDPLAGQLALQFVE